MSLQTRLDRMRDQFESKLPAETLAIMHGATEDLLHSGIMEQVLQKDHQAPSFSLTDQNGDEVHSSELLAKGPLVVSFYRGIW
jgi:hypothetical protein